MRRAVVLLSIAATLCAANTARGEESEDLAKQIQNPLANLVTLPLQANYNTGFGSDDRLMFNLNIQPVVPFPGKTWNIISRTIIPVNSVPQGATDSTFGLGDTSLSLFWSPAKASKLIWGVGPAFLLPTASNPEILGTDKWSLGPTGVIFYETGPWTMGIVASNVWSIAGNDQRENVNLLTAQYFFNFNFGKGWALGTAPIVTANWKADSGDRWTIPWGLNASKLMRFGDRPVNLLLGYYDNATRPDGAAERQFRVQINFLFPTKH
jgi:hypothetical protein